MNYMDSPEYEVKIYEILEVTVFNCEITLGSPEIWII